MKKAELRIAVAPTLRAALEQAARDNACSLPYSSNPCFQST
jgi:hypothetical protein